jgi:lysylphosphatidylglycerol synthetase-like protein (DUF2156 family)
MANEHPSGAPACRRVGLGAGGRAIVASDLFLTDTPTKGSAAAVTALTRALEAIRGPGALVFAGNCFELTPTPRGSCSVQDALGAHLELCRSIAGFLSAASAETPRHVIFLPGTRDRAICHSAKDASALTSLGAEIALTVEVEVESAQGARAVRVEPGWRYDKRNAFADPTDPNDTPLGHHAITDLFPLLGATPSGWLDGIDRLQDPAGLGRFVASRMAYRRLGRYAWWLLVPVAAVLLGRLPALWLFGVPVRVRSYTNFAVDVGATLLLELVSIGVLLAVVNHRIWAGPGAALLGPPAERANDDAREAARLFVADGGAGLVTGHTLRAEITTVGHGFYANTGACSTVVEEHKALFGLPPVFLQGCQVSFVTIDAGAEVHARLSVTREPDNSGSFLERLAAGPRRDGCALAVAGSYPGTSWPPVSDPSRRYRLVRRLVATLVAIIGLLDIVTALLPVAVRGSLHPYLGYVPLGVSAAAGALVGLAGTALVLVARGLRRGQRLAWFVATGILAATTILHIVRQGQVKSAVLSLVVLAALVWARESFQARYDPPAVRAGLLTLLGGAIGVPLTVAGLLEAGVQLDRHHRSLPWWTALRAAAGRLVGIDTVALPPKVDTFLNPAELAIGVGLFVFALVIVFRPVAARRLAHRSHAQLPVITSGGPPENANGTASASGSHGLAAAREVVNRRGSGTLDYFALRDDKEYFFELDGLVAYAVKSGVCLVSPDPICGAGDRVALWARFRRFADERGWAVAVLGASEEWLSIYQASGMRDLYIGDEAVVDITSLSLQGGSKKGLRQAVNRIAKYGYTISFHDPAAIEAELAAALRELMVKSRRGGVERGFSMTLGRIFDPCDTGLLLAVAHGPGEDAPPVAFCQFVPAPGIGGFSLDLMRRDPGEHPNGLLDFILVRTMEHLRQEGYRGVDLNFAMMRAVLAGEGDDRLSTKLERFVLKRMSDSMQIESLWRFNSKFDPDWLARYVVWDSAEQSLAAALAIARAESFWELPIIGRFLVPTPTDTTRETSSASVNTGASRGPST